MIDSHDIPWSIQRLEHSKQTDSVNCGVYVCVFTNNFHRFEDMKFDNHNDQLTMRWRAMYNEFKKNKNK